jgi:hypothetical protein
MSTTLYVKAALNSWQSANEFLSQIKYSGERFAELIQLVSNNGTIT